MQNSFDLMVKASIYKQMDREGGDAESKIMEALIDAGEIELAQVCFKLSPQLRDQIDDACALLRVSKRRFMESAAIKALAEMEHILEQEGYWEHMKPQQKAGKKDD